MGLFGKKAKTETKCDVCDLELPTPERLERHKKKAHGNSFFPKQSHILRNHETYYKGY